MVLVTSIAVSKYIIDNKPEIKKRKRAETAKIAVDALQVTAQDYVIKLQSQGIVQPKIQSTISAEVAGNIIHVSDAFRQGRIFKKGQVLLRVDPRDYQFAVKIAESNLAKTRLALAEEQARSQQAMKNWQNLGGKNEPSDLVLRKPQLEVAETAVTAAIASLDQAKLNVKRTKIRAPYRGRVREQEVDLGQYVTRNSLLATIYAIDSIEVRLPLTNEQLRFLDLSNKLIPVTFSSSTGEKSVQWAGNIIRSENIVDSKTQQLFVVAKVTHSSADKKIGLDAIRIGQFVKAEIAAQHLQKVFVLPYTALRDSHSIMVIDENNKLQRRFPTIVWSNKHDIVITKGLSEKDRVSLTPVNNAINGTDVQVNLHEK